MAGSEPYLWLLASIPAFAALDGEQVRTLYRFCVLRTVARGEPVFAAGAPVEELCIVVSGRVAGGEREAGRGEAVEAAAFFFRKPAQAATVALRETVLLTLAWHDLTAAFRENPSLIESLMCRLWPENARVQASPARLSRLVICPAGSQRSLDPAVRETLIASLESMAEIRLLRPDSFGAGLPGALAIDKPEIAHWFHEQELEFDITLVIPDEADLAFAKEAIEEADGILFVASGGDAGLSELERHALEARGPQNCWLLLSENVSRQGNKYARWIEPRRYGSMRRADFGSPDAVRLMCQGLLGRGKAIAAASRGVYAAAIFGALQALEEHGQPAVCLAAAGSAILPAGLLASGYKPPVIEAVFRELANPSLWKRASRPEAGLCDPAALDSFLVSRLKGLEIPLAYRPFAAVSHSLSTGAPEIHREGRLHGAVRAGIAPAGIFPPLILDGGDILVSGEHETEALIAAAQELTASPVTYLHAVARPLGPSSVTYRSLTASSLFRLTQSPLDKCVRFENLLGASNGNGRLRENVRSLAIPVPEGILPMDWHEWAALRDAAYYWTSKEIDAAAGEQGLGRPDH